MIKRCVLSKSSIVNKRYFEVLLLVLMVIGCFALRNDYRAKRVTCMCVWDPFPLGVSFIALAVFLAPFRPHQRFAFLFSLFSLLFFFFFPCYFLAFFSSIGCNVDAHSFSRKIRFTLIFLSVCASPPLFSLPSPIISKPLFPFLWWRWATIIVPCFNYEAHTNGY